MGRSASASNVVRCCSTPAISRGIVAAAATRAGHAEARDVGVAHLDDVAEEAHEERLGIGEHRGEALRDGARFGSGRGRRVRLVDEELRHARPRGGLEGEQASERVPEQEDLSADRVDERGDALDLA